jgi:hypothetical protein
MKRPVRLRTPSTPAWVLVALASVAAPALAARATSEQIVSIKIVEPQPIPQEPVTTEAEIVAAHRRLMRFGDPGALLRARENQAKLSQIIAISRLPVPWIDYNALPDADEELTFHFCRAPLVAMGRFSPGASMTADDDSDIFTTRTITIDEVFRNNPRAPVKAGDTVGVIHPGGAVRIQGRIVRSVGPTVSHFPHVVMLETYIPATRFYKSNLFAFEIRPDAVEAVNHQRLQHADQLTPAAFLAAARKAASTLPKRCDPE